MPGLLFYAAVIGFTSGMLFRSFFDMRIMDVVFVLFLSFTFAFVWWLRQRPYKSIFFVSAVFLLTLALGIIRFELAEKEVSQLQTAVGESRLWQGVVAREPDVRQTSTHLYVREAETGELILVIVDPFEQVAYGDLIAVEGSLQKPEAFETDTGRTFDYEGYLRARDVSEMIPRGKIERLRTNEGNPILNRLYLVKQALVESLEKAIPEPAVGLGEGLLLGVKRALGDERMETFRIAGIIHIVVLSGYNIMIIADFIMRFLGIFFFPRTRLLVGIAAIVLFALLVGPSATVVRASVMAVLVLIARNTGRTYAILRALCLTGIAMLFINPYLLAYDPGFQLSFLATLGLILLTPRLEERFTKIPSFMGVRGYLASTIGTQIYVLPLLLFSMGALSLVSIFVNLLVLPVVPFAMLITFIVGVVGLISSQVALFLGFGAYAVLMYIIKVAEWAAALPLAEVSVPPFHVSIVFLLFAAIGAWTYFLAKRDKTILATTAPIQENPYADWTIESDETKSVESTELPFK